MVDGRECSQGAREVLIRRKALVAGLALLALGASPAARADAPEGCGAYDPQAPKCEYTATTYGGLSGYGGEPGGWKVTIVRKGERRPLVIRSAGGAETYACGAIMPDDKVTATIEEGSGVFVGNPGICF